MKTITYIVLVLGFSLSGCSSQKKMVENPPFELGNATCQEWKGGRAESGSGLLLEVPLHNENLDQIKLQQAFFRGKIADVTTESGDKGWVAKANFRNPGMKKPDMVMDADAKKEVGNQPPSGKEKFPFELGANECVISYMDGETIKYFKIEGIKEKAPLLYK